MFSWRGVEPISIINLREGPCDIGPGNDAWYPVIDKDRCSECGKCFDFCPFGVYEMVDDRVRVYHPSKCKNNCPACARNCPSEAIIFPKYEYSPINGGTSHEEQAIRVDNSKLYADAFRTRLMNRRLTGTPLFRTGDKEAKRKE
jgi:ferredoxin